METMNKMYKDWQKIKSIDTRTSSVYGLFLLKWKNCLQCFATKSISLQN